MKFLRYLLIFLVIVAVAAAVLHFTAPKEMTVQRTVTVKAPMSAVMDQISNFKNWVHWSPWYKMDTTMKIEYIGADGAVGSGYHWKSEKDMGEGQMNSSFVSADSLAYTLEFMGNWANKGDGFFKLKDNGDGTTAVTWSMHMPSKFPGTVMHVFMDMDKMIGKSFEDGLADMSAYLQAHPSAPGAMTYNIQDVQFPGHNYVTARKTMKISDNAAMGKFFQESYMAMGKAAGARINGPSSTIGYDWNIEKDMADLAAAFPVSGDEPVKGFTMVKVAPSAAYMIEYTGNFSDPAFMGAHEALGKKLAASGKTMVPGGVIEETIIGPEKEKDPSKWMTRIYYLHQ